MPLPPKPALQPWLGLRARLFLSPISIPLISLLFVACRLLMSSRDVTDSVDSAKAKLLTACDAIEGTASLAASLPHFLAAATNAQLAQSVTATVHGAAHVFDLSITAIEKILTYIVDSYRSLFLCFMELLVRGSLAVLIEAVQLISQAITAAAQGIRAAIQDSVQGVNMILSTAVGGINHVVGVFGQHVNPPHIAVPSLTALENITLPHEIQDGLVQLNATLPTLQQLKQTMDALIETPFEQMRTEVNTTLRSFQFNTSVFPVPQTQNVTFCDRIDTSPIDELGDALRSVARWGLVVLALVAVVVVLLGVGWEWWKWQREVKSVERTRAVWLARPQPPKTHNSEKGASNDVLQTENLMSLLTISRHPLISSFSQRFGQRVGLRTQQAQDRLCWLLAFVTHPAALACLFTGLLGLISVWLQTILIQRLTHHYTSSIDTSLTHLTADVLGLVNDHARNASLAFSTSANAVISEVETELNEHVFSWVDTTTSVMNSTLNEFLDGITDALTTTFGGTPFNAPLQTFVQCIIGQKVKGIEKALTWIHDNAHVNFTMVPADVLVLRGAQQEAVLRPVRDAMLGSGDGEDGGVVGNVIGRYMRHLEQEKVMFAVLVAVYALLWVVGVLVAAYASVVDARTSDEGEPEEKEGSDQVEEKLRTSLQAAPSASWFGRFRRPTINRFGKVSPFTTKSSPPPTADDESVMARRTSIAHSNRSNRSRVSKDSISYPFQIHHATTSPSVSRVRQPTPLRQATSAARDTVLSVRPEVSTSAAQPAARSSWLSFLASLATTDEGHTVAQGHREGGEGEMVEESAQDRFQRLFGCSPVASPTTPHFPLHPSVELAAEAQKEDDGGVETEGRKDTGKYRETLDLMPGTGWIGAKSPMPPTKDDAGRNSSDDTEDRPAEVDLIRSSTMSGRREEQGGDASYAFTAAPGYQTRQQPQQPRVKSAQSMSFYAW